MDIYVSNLSFQVDDAALRQAFEAFGDVRKATVVKDRETGKSRGFGFVEMPDPETATRAITSLHGQLLMGRTVNVTEARPRPPGGGPDRRPSGPPYASSSSSSSGQSQGQGGGSFSGGGSGFSGAPRPSAAPFSSAPRFPARPAGDRPRDDDDRERGSGGSDSLDDADEQRRRQARAAAARQHGPNAKAKKAGRFEEGRRLKVLKGVGDGRWRPNLNVATNDDDDDGET